ncbi:hypothetical protein SRABI133_04759 [Peribacillus simplex]|uniref:Uncharacterized protein n=1 Tax=Peribacillus simplex TaxID=1478 RepID=A0A9W4PKT8_9BACI|nr:hypothetical protein SRABI133_04759 [Peribacillus simplex]
MELKGQVRKVIHQKGGLKVDLLLWITFGFIIIGFVVLSYIKRNMDSKQSSTTQSIVWWIVGTTVWGIASIILIVWWFSKI